MPASDIENLHSANIIRDNFNPNNCLNDATYFIDQANM